MTPEIRLRLDYKLKEGEEQGFADAEEADAANRLIAAALAELPKDLPREDRAIMAQITAREVREKFFGPLRPTLGSRVSSFLLRKAMEIRYKERIPRTEGAKTPGKWWGKILDQLDDRPEILALTAAQACWLIGDVWLHDSVQNGFDAQLQRWVNVLDEELRRVHGALNPEGTKD